MHLSPPLGFFLGFSMVRELQLDQMSFNPLPSLSRNPQVEVTSRVSPWMLSEWCSASIVHNQHSVLSHCTPLKRLYSQIKICKQTRRSTLASWMPVGLVPVNNPKFWYLQGSCPLVVQMLHLTGAGWFGLL